MEIASILWRRLDVPGHDACRILPAADGWRIEGAAVARDAAGILCLAYTVELDPGFATLRGRVRGFAAGAPVDVAVERRDREWRLNGQTVAGLEDCLDLDLGFSPATNFAQLRRAVAVRGRTADVPVAWLDDAARTLTRLEQRYERLDERRVAYASRAAGYEAVLELRDDGLVRHYPGLWREEQGSDSA